METRTAVASVVARTGAAVLAVACALPADAATPVRRARLLMGATCSVTAYGDDGVDTRRAVVEALDRIAAAEATLSTWREDSELSRVNRTAGSGPVPVGAELASFLHDGLRLARLSGGSFDPTLGPLVDLWDLRGAGRIPSATELEGARASVGHGKVRLDRDRGLVRFEHPSLWVDAGGIGKGFALDRAAELLRDAGIPAALLDFGGQLLALGSPPGDSGWTVAVADPSRRQRPALLLEIRDRSIATSGQSERGRDVGGRWIGHILDPRTGEPVPRAGSVTVVAPSATEADALATALFVMGPRAGLEWARGRGIAVGFLEPGPEGQLRLSANRPFHSLTIARREFVQADGDDDALGEEDESDSER